MGCGVESAYGVIYLPNYASSQIIIAVPLAVLQKGTIEFSPPLPKSKTSAIKGLGAGLIEKVYGN